MKAFYPTTLVLLICFSAMAQAPAGEGAHVNSLAEVRDMRNVLLLVFHSRVLDVSDRERTIIQDVLKAQPTPKAHFRWIYMQLARKLNKYIEKY
jgi:hypothetical protein